MILPFLQILAISALVQATEAVFVSNLDRQCLKCICSASTGCVDKRCDPDSDVGCGPFFIAKSYWEDAARETASAFHYADYAACVRDYDCASQVVENLMAKHGRDCNGDGITDCDDYARIHFLGGVRCDGYIENQPFYSQYLKCRPIKPDSNPF